PRYAVRVDRGQDRLPVGGELVRLPATAYVRHQEVDGCVGQHTEIRSVGADEVELDEPVAAIATEHDRAPVEREARSRVHLGAGHHGPGVAGGRVADVDVAADLIGDQ